MTIAKIANPTLKAAVDALQSGNPKSGPRCSNRMLNYSMTAARALCETSNSEVRRATARACSCERVGSGGAALPATRNSLFSEDSLGILQTF
jgi:hypothetical protein